MCAYYFNNLLGTSDWRSIENKALEKVTKKSDEKKQRKKVTIPASAILNRPGCPAKQDIVDGVPEL